MIGIAYAAVIASVQSATPAPGGVVVARMSGDAVLIWDASSVVADLHNRKVPNDEALRQVEYQAAQLLIANAPSLKGARTVTLQVVYPRKPEFNPQYNADVLTSVERLMSLEATKDAVQGQHGWLEDIRAAKAPQGLTITITGQLPPN
jgi:hypothetical protein